MGRRMADTAARLAGQLIPRVPVRQWVLSFPIEIRYRLPHDLLSELGTFMEHLNAFYRGQARCLGHGDGRPGGSPSCSASGHLSISTFTPTCSCWTGCMDTAGGQPTFVAWTRHRRPAAAPDRAGRLSPHRGAPTSRRAGRRPGDALADREPVLPTGTWQYV